MTFSELNGWLGALGALALFVYLGYALLHPERF
ncbi:K(+)-transporting ATPase subunit F [Delftia sp. PS-11]|nr:K(+)-transporting ATPase subunit F [Delftia sp. PS-11]KAJ8743600.1 K(+)-transporting ATPase subunit F [Delftia sp. PS-11]